MNYESYENEISRQRAEAIVDTVALVWRTGKRIVTTLASLIRTSASRIGRRLHHD